MVEIQAVKKEAIYDEKYRLTRDSTLQPMVMALLLMVTLPGYTAIT
jgi:hypothetical protein